MFFDRVKREIRSPASASTQARKKAVCVFAKRPPFRTENTGMDCTSRPRAKRYKTAATAAFRRLPGRIPAQGSCAAFPTDDGGGMYTRSLRRRARLHCSKSDTRYPVYKKAARQHQTCWCTNVQPPRDFPPETGRSQAPLQAERTGGKKSSDNRTFLK